MRNLNDLRLFMKVAELRSLSKAAEALGLHKSVISRRIRALEVDLGLTLLHRDHNRIDLTYDGDTLYQEYAQVFLRLAQLDLQTNERETPNRGMIRLSLPMNLANTEFSRHLSRFCAHYPDISLECSLSSVSHQIEEPCDIGLVINSYKLPDSDYVAKRLTFIEAGIYASPDFINTHGPINEPQQLASIPCLCSVENPFIVFDAGRQSLPVQVEGPLKINCKLTQIQGALQGLGVVNLPQFQAMPYVKSGDLIALDVGVKPKPYEIYAVYKDRTLLAPRMLTLIEHLQTTFNA